MEDKTDPAVEEGTDLATELSHSAFALTNLFGFCVNGFAFVHPTRGHPHSHQILLTKLGIEQARLVVWGDSLGIFEFGEFRDSRLDDVQYRESIEKALWSIVNSFAGTDQEKKLQLYGLKPAHKKMVPREPALDTKRLEVFAIKYHEFQAKRPKGYNETRTATTIKHWDIHDPTRFGSFVRHCKSEVDTLIRMFDNSDRVDRAIKQDIKALSWHPVFSKYYASNDLEKLLLVRDCCAEDYPEYSDAADQSLVHMDLEYRENQESMTSKQRKGFKSGSRPNSRPSSRPATPDAEDPSRASSHPHIDFMQSPRKKSVFSLFSRRDSTYDTPRSKSVA